MAFSHLGIMALSKVKQGGTVVFSSLVFLCVFLPVVFLLAVVVRKTPAQNILLAIASLVFYAYGEPVYVILMIATSLFTYFAGLLIGRSRGLCKKALCVISVAICLTSLGIFKYSDWLVGILNRLLQGFAVLPEPHLLLPIGISFYTFQAISYIVDVYRKDVPAQRNVVTALLYISFFPQLIAGPIIRYHDVGKQLKSRKITIEGVQAGLKRFILGLSKKILVADVMAKCADGIFSLPFDDVNAPIAWLGALAYLLQIYFDFSGYSDMAIGMAKMFGFSYKENFNYPYISTSIKEFWRRWHISLSTWLKEYLYIPLGGNRKGRLRTVTNKIFVFICCGLWHGAAWTFVIWGLIHGIFLLIEEYIPIKRLPKPLGWIYMILVVTLAFVVFRSESFSQASFMLIQMLSGWGSWTTAGWVAFCAQMTPYFIFSFVFGCIFSFPILPKVKYAVLGLSGRVQERVDIVCNIACIALLGFCILSLAAGTYSPFIYFRF